MMIRTHVIISLESEASRGSWGLSSYGLIAAKVGLRSGRIGNRDAEMLEDVLFLLVLPFVL
jgi:hypothetical protein